MRVSVVFTQSRHIRKINRDFLQHDYVTDVIAFLFGADDGIESELYVNLDRASSQARYYHVTFTNETRRLLIHGTLHLVGYEDTSKAEKNRMTKREDHYLSLLEERKK